MLNWKHPKTNIERIAEKRALTAVMYIYNGHQLEIALKSYKREEKNYG
jgi:hypothetical protein